MVFVTLLIVEMLLICLLLSLLHLLSTNGVVVDDVVPCRWICFWWLLCAA